MQLSDTPLTDVELINLLREYIKTMSYDLDDIYSRKEKLTFNTVPSYLVSLLILQSKSLFKSEPILLDLTGDFVIIGDLHGHILDLFRILKHFDLPPVTNYIILGDVVDRGEFSVETIILILLIKCLYPKNVYLIRGNHEFKATTQISGFQADIYKIYPHTDLYNEFLDLFSFLPLGAIINHVSLCLHAGLSPNFNNIAQIKQLERPIVDYEDPIVIGMVWSDPRENVDEFARSPRKSGFLFGEAIADEFLQQNDLKYIIRGHECVPNGYAQHFGNRVLTVFSASCYCGTTKNSAAVLVVRASGAITPVVFQGKGYIKRKEALFTRRSMNNIMNTGFSVDPHYNRRLPHTIPQLASNQGARVESVASSLSIASITRVRGKTPSSLEEVKKPRKKLIHPSMTLQKIKLRYPLT